jgi:uncharacterized protein YhaN
MKIRGWQVEGFGIFCDYEVLDLPSGLVLVHGANEAGKSTLLAFLRAVLFGFPDRRGSASTYPPLRGGRHGGALQLENADGIYRVERLGGRRGPLAVVRPDRSEGGEEDLQRLLGGADRQLFASVFAFSLQDLAGIETLSSDQVRARIFSAGIAGAGRSAREVIDGLQEEATSLLSPRAGRLRELVKEAQSISDQIGAAVQRAAEYSEALRREDETDTEVGRLRRELGNAEARVRRATTLIDVWPVESERADAIRSLNASQPIDSFPADPDERLATALGDVRTTTRSWHDANQAAQALVEKRRRIELDDRLAKIAASATERAAECVAHRDRLKRIAELSVEVRQYEDRVAGVLRDLGPAWTETRLAMFDASLPATEEVRDWQQRLAAAKHDTDTGAAALVSFGRQEADVEESFARIVSDLNEQEAALPEDAVRGISARLAAVAEAIAVLKAQTPGLVFDASLLESTAAALASARQECARLGTISGEAKERVDKIVVNETLAAMQERVNEAARHVEVERQRVRDLDNLEVTRRERHEAVERGVRELGDGWMEARASGVPTDFEQLKQVREFAVGLTGEREAVIAAERELDHVGKGRSAREKDLQRLRDQLATPEPISTETLERQNRSLRRLRTRLAELAQLDSDLRAEERISTDAVAEEPALREMSWIRSAPRLAGATSVVLALFAAWRVLAADVIGGIGFAAGSLLAALLAFGLRFLARHVRPSSDATARRQHRVEEAQRRIADIKRRGIELRGAISEDTRLLGLPDLPTLDQVEDRHEEWSSARDGRRRRDDLASTAAGLAQELENWLESEGRRKAEHDEALERAAHSTRLWKAWLAAKGLPPAMTPNTVRDLLLQIRSLQDRIAERNATVERLQLQQEAWQAWRTNAEAILAASDNTASTAIDAGTLFERLLDLQGRCGVETVRTRERALLQEEVADWSTRLALAESAVLRARSDAMSAMRTAYERLVAEWHATETARRRQQEQLEVVARGFESTSSEWSAWQASHGLDRLMSADGVLDFFAGVCKGRDEIERRDRITGELDTIRAAVVVWERQVAELVSALGSPVPEGAPASWIDATSEVARRCASDAEARRDAKSLDVAIAETDLRVAAAKRERDGSQERLSALFTEAGVSSEEEFRARLAHYRSREVLKQQITELETRIVTVLGRGDEAEEIRVDLGTGRVDEWRAEQLQWSTEVESLRERHEAAIRQHQDLSNARRQLEQAADIAELELQLQAVREELTFCTHRHRVTSLAAALVNDTLRQFEHTRQPAVLANASQAFERVTDGRYSRVVQTEGAEDVVVMDRRGARRAVNELSRGTQEQLYLSMRLGLAREFAQRAVPLPLVMDDVLVNFDEARARRMASELLEFAETQQVLLFTCHTFVRSMLLDLDPEVCIIDLPVHDVAGGETMASQRQVPADVDRLESISSAGLEDAVLAVLASVASLSLPELVERLASSPELVRRALSELREKGLVVMSGQKRGARYSLGTAAEA